MVTRKRKLSSGEFFEINEETKCRPTNFRKRITQSSLPKSSFNNVVNLKSFFKRVKALFAGNRFNNVYINENGENMLQRICRCTCESNDDQKPCLMRRKKCINIVRILCDSGADVNFCNPLDGTNALMTAIKSSSQHDVIGLEVARELIRRGIDINHQNFEGSNALNVLCHYNHDLTCHQLLTFANLLVTDTGIDVNVRNIGGTSNLSQLLLRQDASTPDAWSVISLLLEKGFDLEPYREETMWLLCCWKNNLELDQIIPVMRHLVQMKVNVNSRNHLFYPDYEDTALMLMLYSRMVRTNKELSEADEKCWLEIFQIFLDGGLNVNTPSISNETILMIVCGFYRGKNFIDLLRLLLGEGADVNAKIEDGARVAYDEYKKLSHYKHSDWNVFDYFVANSVQQHRFLEVYELFLRHGKRVNDSDMERSLLLAEINGKDQGNISSKQPKSLRYFLTMKYEAK